MQLNANHITFAYTPQRTVLHDVSLTVKAGETLYVLGRNGSGKTTLLSCLAGLLIPDCGQVQLNGNPIGQCRVKERAKWIGLIPQEHIPVFAYTVEDIVMMGRAPYLGWLGSPTHEDRRIVTEAMEQVGISELRERPYTQISGGERQLVLIARGLAQKCQVLLMDEPTTHLDLSNQQRVLEIIQQLSQQGLSFVISSHAPNDALAYADHVLLLTGGWVTEYGAPQDILTESLLSTVYGIQTEVIYEKNKGRLIPRAVVPRRPKSIHPSTLDQPGSLLADIFDRSEVEPQLVIVTGLSGAGKTTWCSDLVTIARKHGYEVRGILSPGIYEGRHKIGIAVRNLETDKQRHMAKIRDKNEDKLSTPRWAFDEAVIAWANTVLTTISHSDLLIIDELGPLEFIRDEGLTAGLTMIDHGHYRVACVVVRSSLLPNALQRWPNAMVINGVVS